MAELKREDIIEDAALEAPLILAKNLEQAYMVITKIAKASKEIPLPTASVKDLADETAKLTAEQKELEKVTKQIAVVNARNNEEYIKEAKVLKEVQKALKENIALGDKDTKQINQKNSSLKTLEAALAKNRDAYKNLANEEARAGKEGQELLKIIQQQDKGVKEINGNLGKFTDNVGNYEGAFKKAGGSLQQIAPGASSAATGMLGLVKASLAFIATPIGIVVAALGAAFFALKSYFAGSEEGQNRLNKIVLVGKVLFEKFMDVVEDIGEALYNAFQNPQEALKEFGKLIVENVVNRLKGLLLFIPRIGDAIGLLFKGEFAAAGKVAFDAVAQVVTGVENATDKIVDFMGDVKAAAIEAEQESKRLHEIQVQLDKEERAMISERARVALEVSKLRAKAVEEEGAVRKKTIEEAIALEEKLASREIAIAKLKLEQAQLNAKTFGADKEALTAIAEARAALYNAEATAFDNTLRFKKEIAALDEAEAKKWAAIQKEKEEQSAEYFKWLVEQTRKSITDNAEVQQKELDSEVRRIQQAVIAGVKTREQGAKEVEELQKKQAARRIEIEMQALQKELELYGVTAEQKAIIAKKLYDLEGKLLAAQVANVGAAGKSRLQMAIEIADKVMAVAEEISHLTAALTQRRINDLELESEKNEEHLEEALEREERATDRRLEDATLSEEQKKQIEETSEARKAALQLQAEKREQDIEKRKKQAIRKQAIFEKSIALSKGAINLGAAIIAALTIVPPASFAAAALTAAIAAIQLATIAATPIPAAQKGIKGHKGGPIIAGEAGAELVRMPGNRLALTSAVATMYDLPKGTDIIPHEETMRMLAADGLRVSSLRGVEVNSRIEKKLDRINATIKNKREWNLTGHITGYNDGGTRARYIESLRNRPT